jgi:hypothetical protein
MTQSAGMKKPAASVFTAGLGNLFGLREVPLRSKSTFTSEIKEVKVRKSLGTGRHLMSFKKLVARFRGRRKACRKNITAWRAEKAGKIAPLPQNANPVRHCAHEAHGEKRALCPYT